MSKRGATPAEDAAAIQAAAEACSAIVDLIIDRFGPKMEGVTGGSWKDVVLAAADQALGEAWDEAFGPLKAIVDRLSTTERRLALDVENVAQDLACALSTRYLLMGFALAKTWPAGPEDLDQWVARARAYIGDQG